MDRGGENLTGEEDEQRILLETGGGDVEEGDDCKSSKKFDLLPHNIADMLCRLNLSTLVLLVCSHLS